MPTFFKDDKLDSTLTYRSRAGGGTSLRLPLLQRLPIRESDMKKLRIRRLLIVLAMLVFCCAGIVWWRNARTTLRAVTLIHGDTLVDLAQASLLIVDGEDIVHYDWNGRQQARYNVDSLPWVRDLPGTGWDMHQEKSAGISRKKARGTLGINETICRSVVYFIFFSGQTEFKTGYHLPTLLLSGWPLSCSPPLV